MTWRDEENLMEEIFTVTSAMKNLIPYVCRSHLIFAANWGEGYLPYQRDSNNNPVIVFPYFSNIDDAKRIHIQATLDTIGSKILPNMVTNEQEFGINTSYKNPKLVQSIKNNTVTKMCYKAMETEKTNNKWDIEDPSTFSLSRFLRCISSSPV